MVGVMTPNDPNHQVGSMHRKPRPLPKQTPEAVRRLRSLVKSTGFVRPGIVDARTGVVIDGVLSTALAKELGLPVPQPAMVALPRGVSAAAARVACNLPTRKWTAQEVTDYISEHPELSDRTIADRFQKSPTSVGKYRKEATVQNGQTKRLGRDGRERALPQRRATLITPKSGRDSQAIPELVGRLDRSDRLPSGVKSTASLRKVATRIERERIARIDGALPATLDLRHCDFRDLRIKTSSIDTIFCDVPWQQLELAKPFAEWSYRVLRKGGSLVFYPGHCTIWEWFSAVMAAGFQWKHQIVSMFGGNEGVPLPVGDGYTTGTGSGMLHREKMVTRYNPILWVTKGEFTHDVMMTNLMVSPMDKLLHPRGWQTSLSDAVTLLGKICPARGVVCDPFGGVFTTALAVHQIGGGRKIISSEIDEFTFKVGKGRVVEETARRKGA